MANLEGERPFPVEVEKNSTPSEPSSGREPPPEEEEEEAAKEDAEVPGVRDHERCVSPDLAAGRGGLSHLQQEEVEVCSSQPSGGPGWTWPGGGTGWGEAGQGLIINPSPSDPPSQPVATNVSRGAPAPFLLLSGCYWGNWPWPANWEPLPHPNLLSSTHSPSPSPVPGE